MTDNEHVEAVEKALSDLRKEVDVYYLVDEIEGLIASLEERIASVKRLLHEFDSHIARGHNRFFGHNEGPR